MPRRILDRVVRALVGVDLDFSINMQSDRFSAINEYLVLGGRPLSDEHIVNLQSMGVTRILSCLPRDNADLRELIKGTFDHQVLTIRDGMHQDVSEVCTAAYHAVEEARLADPSAKLLVHCEVGVSRSATAAIAYLMRKTGKNFWDVYMDVKAKRPQVLPNIGFASYLQQLEFEILPERRGISEPSSLAQYLREICNTPVEIEILEEALRRTEYDSIRAIHTIFGPDIPRVIQGVRR